MITLTKYYLTNHKYQQNIMKKWQSTQTRGFIKAVSLILMTSAITMGSSIASPIPPLANPTSEESTSCRKENLEVESEELQASQTGDDILEVLKSLNKTLESWAKRISEERSSQSIPPQVESIMKKQDNSF